MSARNAPGGDDRRLRDGERRISERLGGQLDCTAGADNSSERRTDPVNVWAHGYYTVGTRGRLALTTIVLACVFCGRAHRHNGRPDFTSGKRKASCGHGTYVVHLGTVEGQVAA